MKYLIKRTEVFEGDAIIGYLQESGVFGNKRTARVFADREKAEDYIDTERCDPIYDKAFMGECTFEIEEIDAGFGRSKASAKYNESNVKQVKMKPQDRRRHYRASEYVRERTRLPQKLNTERHGSLTAPFLMQ